MDANLKRVFKFFWAWDMEKEEDWLNEMSKKGYKLEKARLAVFTFRKAEKDDYIYKLSYKRVRGAKRQEYNQLFKDFGWEYVTYCNCWNYFRKKASDSNEEIYTDNESRAEIFKTLLIFIVLMTIVCVPMSVINLGYITYDVLENGMNKFYYYLTDVFIYIFDIALYTFATVKLTKKYKSLKRDIL
ncbi:DUF2812 domain-containing protein [Clostridium sp. 19966]|uniref:DUF2812 domain-containing protein n=1 Tax=Clostridium sp. 19966 TaxID=2768166 RepID=UPI0028DE3DA8|nr:DUF2812 domain-containing protein [Clostridium sp. 19966]MDT8716771.1 DUF2812 domain-containing protein [Clostridium sp. 19966]